MNQKSASPGVRRFLFAMPVMIKPFRLLVYCAAWGWLLSVLTACRMLSQMEPGAMPDRTKSWQLTARLLPGYAYADFPLLAGDPGMTNVAPGNLFGGIHEPLVIYRTGNLAQLNQLQAELTATGLVMETSIQEINH